MGPYCAILRYYRCDTPMPHIARYFLRGGWHSPNMVPYPPLVLSFTQAHFATYRAIIVRYPIKTSTKQFSDTIAASITQYEKYRCWASKPRSVGSNMIIHTFIIWELISQLHRTSVTWGFLAGINLFNSGASISYFL